MSYVDEKIRARLEWYTRAQAPHTERIQALSALYIGDGLREIATAITSATNPTDEELAQRLAVAVSLAEKVVASIEATAAPMSDNMEILGA